MYSPASGAVQWRKVAHRLSVGLACAIPLLGLGLLGMHVSGYRLFPTRGDSMEPASSAGSLLIARLTAPEDIRVSDFIVFPEASQTLPFTAHRVAVVVKTESEQSFSRRATTIRYSIPSRLLCTGQWHGSSWSYLGSAGS